MTNIAIIPAKGTSARIPRKNLKEFHGKPIICYSIECALASNLFDDVLVSTDDPEIAAVAIKYGARYDRRPLHLLADSVGTQDVAAHVVENYRAADLFTLKVRVMPDYACCIYPTAPLMLPEDLQAGYKRLVDSGKSFVFSMGPAQVSGTFQVSVDGELSAYASPGGLADAGNWYWGKTQAFVDTELFGPDSLGYVLPAERTCDINTMEDFARAERLYEALQSKGDVVK